MKYVTIVALVILAVMLYAAFAGMWEGNYRKGDKLFSAMSITGALALVSMSLIRLPFLQVRNYIVIGLAVVLIAVTILLLIKALEFGYPFPLTLKAKDNILAKLDPENVEASLSLLSKEERTLFLVDEFEQTREDYGFDVYLQKTSGVHVKELPELFQEVGASEFGEILKDYLGDTDIEPSFQEADRNDNAFLVSELNTAAKKTPLDELLEEYVKKNYWKFGLKDTDLQLSTETRNEIRKNHTYLMKTDPIRYKFPMYSGTRYGE